MTLTSPDTVDVACCNTTPPDRGDAVYTPLAETIDGYQAERPTPARPTLKAELQVFLSTFLTIFLAEIGDKTQLTVLLMSAESHTPWVVFLGASSALIATSLCGVLLGRWLCTRVAPHTLERTAGGLLLLISALLVWDVVMGS